MTRTCTFCFSRIRGGKKKKKLSVFYYPTSLVGPLPRANRQAPPPINRRLYPRQADARAFHPDIPGWAFIIHNIHLTLRGRHRRRRHRFSFINKPEPISQIIIIIIIIQSDAKLYAQTYFVRYSTPPPPPPHAVFKYYYRYYRRRRLHDPRGEARKRSYRARVYRYEFIIVLRLNSSRQVTAAARPDSGNRKLAHALNADVDPAPTTGLDGKGARTRNHQRARSNPIRIYKIKFNKLLK